MELCNELGRHTIESDIDQAVVDEGVSAALLLLCPIVPHVTEALYKALTGSDITTEAWPAVDEAALARDEVEIVVQVNGKVRAKMTVAADADKASVEASALAQDNVQRFIAEATVRKVIVVPGKLVNVVAN